MSRKESFLSIPLLKTHPTKDRKVREDRKIVYCTFFCKTFLGRREMHNTDIEPQGYVSVRNYSPNNRHENSFL